LEISASPVFFPDEDRKEILETIDSILQSGQLTLGRYGQVFESEFAKLVGVKHAIAVNSGTSALEIILRSLNVTDREVVVPTNTFFATAAAALHAGGRVRFADVDRRTLCADAKTIEAALRPRSAAVSLVHSGGLIGLSI